MKLVSAMQVFLRLQWVRQVVRGRYMNAEMTLAGLGLVVMGGLQDELFNLTIDRVHVSILPHNAAASCVASSYM